MLSVPFLVITSILLPVVTCLNPDPLEAFGIPSELWNCGTADFLKEGAIRSINQSCPKAAPVINHCCSVHDDCYSNQKGQKVCDDEFCACLDNIVETHKAASRCDKLSRFACNMVRVGGESAYSHSAHPDFPFPQPKELRKVPRLEMITLEYLKVYEECRFQNVTFASCALNYDICIEKSDDSCKLGLIRCLQKTKEDRLKNRKCDESVERIVLKLLHEDTENITELNRTFLIDSWRNFSHPPHPIFLVLLLFGALLFCGILVIIGLARWNDRVVLVEPPTSVVTAPTSAVSSLRSPSVSSSN